MRIKGGKEMTFVAELLAKLGIGAANVGTQACSFFIFDEPKMPNSLIEK